MHRCPQCDYAFGPIAGIPADRFGAFTADVKCPECGVEIPEGSRLLVGSTIPEGAQPLTRRRRLRQLAIGMLPALWLLQYGFRGLANVVTQGPRNARATDILGVLMLVLPLFVMRAVWRHWQPRAGEDGGAGALASRDVRWLCMPGAMVLFHGNPEVREGGPGFKMGSGGHFQFSRKVDGSHLIEVANLRSIRVHAPAERGRKRKADDRIVATITANEWVTDRHGVRRDIKQWSINIDTDGDPGQPGTDRAAAAVEAGDRLANLLRDSVGLHRRTEAPTATAVYGADPHGAPIVVEGSRHALLPLQERMVHVVLPLVVPLFIALPGTMLAAAALIERFRQPASGGGVATLMASPSVSLYAWISVAVVAALGPCWWLLRRRAIRRQDARCRWEVGHVGLRITEIDCDRVGNVVGQAVRDVPAWDIERVGIVTTKRRIRLVASNHQLKELATVTLDEIPEGGAEALAERVRARLGKSAPADKSAPG